MTFRLRTIALPVFCTLLQITAFAGVADGMAAYKQHDYSAALREFKEAASTGDAAAQYQLANMYRSGQGVASNLDEAVKWYRLAADHGNADAQLELGFLYLVGTLRNYQEAAKLFRMAADQGVAMGQFSYGGMYERGYGVAQDTNEAVKWFRMAAAQGYDVAQFKLARMFQKGEGVTQDYKEALKWCRLAADQRNAGALLILGEMYQSGNGVLESRNVAYVLYSLSAMANTDRSTWAAEQNRTKLAQTMSPPEIRAAQDLIRAVTQSGQLLKTLDKYAKSLKS